MAVVEPSTPASADAGSTTAATVVTTQDFLRAFDKQRTTLAGFAKCSNRDELDVVRDGFYLGLAKDLCPDAYKAVLVLVLRKRFQTNQNDIKNDKTGQTEGLVEEGGQGFLSMSFEEMVIAARACDQPAISNSEADEIPKESDGAGTEGKASASATTTPETDSAKTHYWKDLVDAVLRVGDSVGSDLESIWKTLEEGRLQWLRAASAAHPLKAILQKALEDDNALDSKGDVSDAMMVWIYAICLALSEGDGEEQEGEPESAPNPQTAELKAAVEAWATAVNMTDKHNPLKGYQAELWDPRREEWRALDLGAQEAAERGGSNLLEAWKAR